MTQAVAVDVEQMLTRFLRSRTEITALVADRVYTDLPNSDNRTYPLIIVNRVGGGFLYKRWLESAEMSVACYGTTHKSAQDLAGTVISIVDMLAGSQPEGVVTKVSVTSTAYVPEPESADSSGHARPRFTVSLTVITHPTQA